MAKNKLRTEYFDWIYRLVLGENTDYKVLLLRLNDIPFAYSIPMDGNREADGIDLRYRFGYENDIPDYIIANYLDQQPCSVLEMMAALYLRFEEQIEGRDCFGNDTAPSGMFMSMLDSLGLVKMTNKAFNIDETDGIISSFLDRTYAENGKGGLFTVEKRHGMPSVEIWYQMMYWADENVL